MDFNKILSDHMNKQKQYVEMLMNKEEPVIAAYKAFGTETGDAIVMMKQGEINTKEIQRCKS